MSFLLDKAFGAAKQAITGREPRTDEQQKAEDDYYNAVRKYRDTIFSWVIDGVTKSRIKEKGLWIDDLLAINAQSMGGPPPTGGLPLFPGFVPPPTRRTSPGAMDAERVARDGQVFAQVQRIEGRSQTSGRPVSAVLNDTPAIEQPREAPRLGSPVILQPWEIQRFMGFRIEMKNAEGDPAKIRDIENRLGNDRPAYDRWLQSERDAEIAQARREASGGASVGVSREAMEAERAVERARQAEAESHLGRPEISESESKGPVVRPFRYFVPMRSNIKGGKKKDAEAFNKMQKDMGLIPIDSEKIRQALYTVFATKNLTTAEKIYGRKISELLSRELNSAWGASREVKNDVVNYLESLGMDVSPTRSAADIAADIIGQHRPQDAPLLNVRINDLLNLLKITAFNPWEMPTGPIPSPEADIPPNRYLRDHETEIRARLNEHKMPVDMQDAIMRILGDVADRHSGTIYRPGYEENIMEARRSAIRQLESNLRQVYAAQEARFHSVRIDQNELFAIGKELLKAIPYFAETAFSTPQTLIPSMRRHLAGAARGLTEIARGGVEPREIIGSTSAERMARFEEVARVSEPIVEGGPGAVISIRGNDRLSQELREVLDEQPMGPGAVITVRSAAVFREENPNVPLPEEGKSIDNAPLPYTLRRRRNPPGPPIGRGPRRGPGGGPGGGGPPGGGPPGGGGGYIIQYFRRAWRATSLASVFAILLSIYVNRDEALKYMRKLFNTGEVEIPVPPKDEDKSPEKPSGDNIPPEVEPPMNTSDGNESKTYLPGIDGRPRLFPVPTPRPDSGYIVPQPIPVGSAHELPVVDKFALPPLTQPVKDEPYDPEVNKSYGIDLDNNNTIALIESHEEALPLFLDYNELIERFNDAREAGDYEEASKIYKLLRTRNAEISNEFLKSTTRGGLDRYQPIRLMDLEYDAVNNLDRPIKLSRFIDKTARTHALGSDEFIDKYNFAAEDRNALVASGFDPAVSHDKARVNLYRDAMETMSSSLTEINRRGLHPEYVTGTTRPKLIEEKLPKRVTDIIENVLNKKQIALSESDQELLAKYPQVDKLVTRYANLAEGRPEGADSVEMTKLRGDLYEYKTRTGYLLDASMRPFAEAPHIYPANVTSVIARIADLPAGSKLELSEYERKSVSKYPELYDRVKALEEAESRVVPVGRPSRGGRVTYAITPESAEVESIKSEFRDIRENKYVGLKEPIRKSIEEIEDRLAVDRRDYNDVTRRLNLAIESGAPRSLINDLSIEQRRINARLRDNERDLAGRGTYLGDPSLEHLPGSDSELDLFRRLQNVESEVQGFPGLLESYNEAVAGANFAGYSKTDEYNVRLQLLRSIMANAGLQVMYDSAVAREPDRIDEDDTIVTLPDNPNATKDQGEGTERANVIDPDEQALFLKSDAEERAERKRWDEYSYVAPGFGLGGPRRNTLQRANLAFERRRFGPNIKIVPQGKEPKPKLLIAKPYRNVPMIPIYENAYGREVFEDSFHNDYQRGDRVIFSNPYMDAGDQRTWDSDRSIYQPDRSGYRYAQLTNTPMGIHNVPIGEVSKPHEYYGTNKRFYQTNGPNCMLQNIANNMPARGEQTMITTERSGEEDLKRHGSKIAAIKMPLTSTRN